jgi:hypothetical protein
MKKIKQVAAMLALSSVIIVSCDKDEDDDYNNQPAVQSTIVAGAGDSTAVAGKMAEFRLIIGDPLNTTPNQAAGRREVNWDGVPAGFTNNTGFPLDFFGKSEAAEPNGRKRGLIYANNGTLIRVDSTDFSEIDPSYAGQFEPFSRKRLVIAAGTIVSEILFKVPGTTTDASVKGFGIVFVDVDDANSTFIEFFNGTKSLGKFKAPAAAGSGKFSFLGVHFPAEKITRLKITSGNAALAAGVKDITDGGTKDLVVYDDFLYSEPVAVQ